MNVHAITTGTVRITKRWLRGNGPYAWRLLGALSDLRMTDALPIWCFVIEHPDGLIVIDTGIPHNANDRVWFPPFMPLVQRAAPFQIDGEPHEIGPQLMDRGLSPADVRTVILTHLHQDHEGGLHHFPSAAFWVSAAEWEAARGLKGRLGGYLNFRWPADFAPMCVRYDEPDPIFGGRQSVTAAGDVYVVPTPGHSAGHQSVVVDCSDHVLFFAGDASYSQSLLLADAVDGVGMNAAQERETHARILELARHKPLVYLPSHEWASKERLQNLDILPMPKGDS